jgi:hypothetical protein
MDKTTNIIGRITQYHNGSCHIEVCVDPKVAVVIGGYGVELDRDTIETIARAIARTILQEITNR